MSEIITLEKEVCRLASGSIVVRIKTDNVEIGTHRIKAIENMITSYFEKIFNLKEIREAVNSPEFKGDK